jgi:hypothetical protein
LIGFPAIKPRLFEALCGILALKHAPAAHKKIRVNFHGLSARLFIAASTLFDLLLGFDGVLALFTEHDAADRALGMIGQFPRLLRERGHEIFAALQVAHSHPFRRLQPALHFGVIEILLREAKGRHCGASTPCRRQRHQPEPGNAGTQRRVLRPENVGAIRNISEKCLERGHKMRFIQDDKGINSK